MNPMSPMTAVTYAALLLSVIALPFARRSPQSPVGSEGTSPSRPAIEGFLTPWSALLAGVVIAGYVSGVLYGPGALWIALFAGLCLAYSRAKALDSPGKRRALVGLSAAAILVVALGLGLHVLPGFRNFLALDDVALSPGAAPYTLYLNVDKTVVGLCILGLLHKGLLAQWKDWSQALRKAVPLIAINTVVVALFAMMLGYLHWQPRWTPLFWIWAASNLFFTCLSEEALFRGFIQRELAEALRGKPFGTWVPIAVAAALFGIAHIGGGWSYVALATAAGLGYGIVYHRTRSIEMAMLAHFALNATHFLLFTYPRSG
jgi:membrane protease YdiL (CAAX protease family)